MTQNKVDKIAGGKVIEELKDNEEKYKIRTRSGDYPKKLIIGSGTSFEGTSIKTEDIEIYGRIEANIKSNVVYVGAAAEVFGSVICNQIEVHGKTMAVLMQMGKRALKKVRKSLGLFGIKLFPLKKEPRCMPNCIAQKLIRHNLIKFQN